MGARAMATGNAATCNTDEWSVLNNIGGLSEVSGTTVAFSQYAVPSFKPFNRMAATIAVPVRVGTIGAAFFRFGDDLYNEHLFTVGYGNKFGLASLGLRVNYIQYHAEGFGTSGNFTLTFGGIAELTPRLLVGATVENINQPRIAHQLEERIPTRFLLGVGLKLSEKVFAITEIEKDLENTPIAKAGIEYEIHRKFTTRTGFNLNPQSAFGGVGFTLRKFKLDYALQFHEYLGAAHQASVIISFRKKK